jgi:Zn-dependent M28 family amino/carboxypeptidase
MVAQAGFDLDALRRAAGSRDFRPVPLRTRATASLRSSLRSFEAANVIGRIPGRDAASKDETVIFSAHVDHLGIGTPDAGGDRIYNGAVDDAAGVAALLEIARTVRAAGGWSRSVTFLGFTAEEQGLKGSAWYAAHPVVPPGRTAGCVNLDAAMPFGEVDDFILMGADRSPELARIGADTAGALGFTVRPDGHPEKGYFYRSDHFSLARIGIPCVNLQMGETLRGKPAGAGAARVEEYRKKRYHQPADQLDGTWDFAGLGQYATVAREIGRRIAALPVLPGWKPGDEFAAARERR